MWRVHGFVGRVLNRCYGNSNPLRLPQNHHVEDEVINSSTLLSTSRHSSDSSYQREGNGERQKKQRTSQFDYTKLDGYTALDAVGWGAAAALFMQLCRRIHSQLSSGREPASSPGVLTAPSAIHKCSYRILLEILSRRDVLPRGSSVLCLQGALERHNQDLSPSQSSSSSNSSSSCSSSSSSLGDADPLRYSEQDLLTADSSISNQQRALLDQDSPIHAESLLSASCPLQNDADRDDAETKYAKDKDTFSVEEKLAEAALNFKHVGDISTPVILNIIGIENTKSKNYLEAFICFLAAAQQGYSKAQFNTGVCYELGRGVSKDTEKALYYYQQAAVGGHREAQYRYAKLLLTSGGLQSLEKLNMAIHFLESAAAAGLTKAQLCLASVYYQEVVRDGNKCVQYLKMAAESGDNTALLFLGQCFESGFGLQQTPTTTVMEYYRRACRSGNKQAKGLLTPLNDTHCKVEDGVSLLRSIRSAPCFSAGDPQQTLSSLARRRVTLPVLPHSWSTGSLCSPSTHPHLHPNSTQAGACQWTLGVG